MLGLHDAVCQPSAVQQEEPASCSGVHEALNAAEARTFVLA